MVAKNSLETGFATELAIKDTAVSGCECTRESQSLIRRFSWAFRHRSGRCCCDGQGSREAHDALDGGDDEGWSSMLVTTFRRSHSRL
ncbi:hypothetical protein L484_020236 [Morus notabilis]|uniref:Uncharacterized protein n=1 Tax=Morus notabilis TaxID=981085 RepID=W9SBS4_9ROSA|nr:hypothetical protein L484_020236 [Morus notabilis]